MYLANAILILLVVGSGASPSNSSNILAGRHPLRESQPANAQVTAPRAAIGRELAGTQEDRQRLAQIAYAEGKLLESQGTAESLRKALEKYEKALALSKSLNDRSGQAMALGGIGTASYRLGERQRALDVFQQQLQIWRATGAHQREVAEAVHNIGVVYDSMGFAQKAIHFYQEALPLRRAAGDRAGLAITLDSLGLSYISTGELQKASDYCNQALAIFAELNDRAGLANTLNNIGGINFTLGDYRKALEYFSQSLELRRALGHRRDEAIALNNIGRVYDLLGEAQKALDYHHQALGIRRTLGNPAMEAGSINNIGFVYDWLGEKQKALERYKQAHDLFRAANDRDNQARTLINIGALYLDDDPQTALDYFQQALEITRVLGQPIQQASVLGNIGLVHLKSGNLAKALENYRQALEMHRAAGHRPGEAASLNQLGAIFFAKRELQVSHEYFKQALQLYRVMGTRGPEAITLFGIARVERERDNLGEALLRMEESLKILESLRGSVSSHDLRASFLAQRHEYFEFYTDLLMRLHQREPSRGHDVAAFHSSERAHARSLLELLAEARIDVEQGIAPELKQRERLINRRIAWIQSRLIDAYAQSQTDQSRIKTLEEDLKQVDSQREQLNSEIRRRHPRYADLQYPAPPELKAIQSLLDDQTVLLEYALGKDASFLFAVTRNDFAVARLSSDASIARQVEALRATITARPQRSTFPKQMEYSRKLYRELIEPAGKLLSGKRKLIIVPSGILHYLPFETLLSSGEERTLATVGLDRWPFLLKNYAISYVPSAGVLTGLRNRPPSSPEVRKTFLAFADPAYVNDRPTEVALADTPQRGAFGDQQTWKLGRLPESRREVEQIARLYAKDKVSLLLGAEASEENVKAADRFRDYRYVHFATHGLLNEERPPYSGLILSLAAPEPPRSKPTSGVRAEARGSGPTDTKAGSLHSASNELDQRAGPQTEDGLLQVYEIFHLKLNADLVVLSACETGLGKQVKGEGLVGLTHAFFYAGTPSILVSLWKVQDRSTADLMVNLYQQLDMDKDKAEALRMAKLQLIQQKRYAHPYYWAPFVLTGEPK
jgi:CHAT domain-containing protein/Tfp pilus assembly protein PilF